MRPRPVLGETMRILELRFTDALDPSDAPQNTALVIRQIALAVHVANVAYLAAHSETPSLLASGVRYVADEPHDLIFRDIGEAIREGAADCKTLACWYSAERTIAGDPAFPRVTWWINAAGVPQYHVDVAASGGRAWDPSEWVYARRLSA